MSTDYGALREAAEAVDLADGEIGWYDANDEQPSEIHTWDPSEIQFIAAASPDVVLALLDEVEALRAKVARVEVLVTEWDMSGRMGHHNAAGFAGALRAALDDSNDDRGDER
jgi:hypothetical protein